jgi:hypothetical protein
MRNNRQHYARQLACVIVLLVLFIASRSLNEGNRLDRYFLWYYWRQNK